VGGKHLPSGDINAEDDGSRQRRIESAETSVGHIAGAVVAVLLIIAILLVIVSRAFCLSVWRFCLFGKKAFSVAGPSHLELYPRMYPLCHQ